MAATAQTVAVALRRGGVMTVPRGREGVHVTRGYANASASVSVNLDSPRRAREMAAAVAEVLTAAGYTVTPFGTESHLFRITRDA